MVNKMENSVFIGAFSIFKNEVFVFIVINKVLNIMNIFVDCEFASGGHFRDGN